MDLTILAIMLVPVLILGRYIDLSGCVSGCVFDCGFVFALQDKWVDIMNCFLRVPYSLIF